MENKFLIDLGIKFGLDNAQTAKVADMVYQCGIDKVDSREAKRVATYICEMNLLAMPAEELIEELRRKGFASGDFS